MNSDALLNAERRTMSILSEASFFKFVKREASTNKDIAAHPKIINYLTFEGEERKEGPLRRRLQYQAAAALMEISPNYVANTDVRLRRNLLSK